MTTSINFTPEQNKLIDWAIDTLIEKHLAAGGNPKEMMTRREIDFFFCGLLQREGEEAVKSFIDNYKYTPTRKTLRGYA